MMIWVFMLFFALALLKVISSKLEKEKGDHVQSRNGKKLKKETLIFNSLIQ